MFESYSRLPERKVLKISLLLILGFICWVTVIEFLWTTPEDSAAAIERSAILREHDQMCLDLPRPADFRLESKMLGGNSFTRSISYRYKSFLLYAQVRDYYIENLLPLGWTVSDRYEEEMSPIAKSISFKNGKYRIVLEYISATGGSIPGEYDINCNKFVN